MDGHDPPLTIERAAAMVGVERETFWRWLTGRRQPNTDDAFRLQDVFGVYAGMWARGRRPIDL